MSKIDLRAYHRALALYCLGKASAPCTAGDLAEHMGSLAMSEGHPKAWWSSINPSSVVGHLRSLERDGQIEKAGERANPRYGREEPLWRFIGQETPRCPDPSEFEGEEAPPAAAMPPLPVEPRAYADMTREQLLTVLRINDEVALAAKRFITEILDISERGRRALVAVGVDVPA